MQAGPDKAVHLLRDRGLLLGAGKQVMLQCQEGQEVRTLLWESEFLINIEEDGPKMFILAHNLSLPLSSFCLEMGIQVVTNPCLLHP